MVGGVTTTEEGNALRTFVVLCINQRRVVRADVVIGSAAIATTVAGIEIILLQMIFAISIGKSS